MKRIEAEIHEQATSSIHSPVIQALQTMRGVAEVTAVTLVAEIGQFSRFSSPRQLMSYAGLVPKEYSSGASRWQGSITKIGNAHIRHVLVESAWSYRHHPSLKGQIRARQEGKDPEAQRIAWKAQHRLHQKYHRITSRGKAGKQAAVAEYLAWNYAFKVLARRQSPGKENPHVKLCTRH